MVDQITTRSQWDSSVNINRQSVNTCQKKLQSCILSDCTVMQTHTQLKLHYFTRVCLKKKLNEFDRLFFEMGLTIAFVLPGLLCSPLAAGWHRSCGRSLDNHMISFCSSSGGSRKTNSHNVVNPLLYKVTTHLLWCYKYPTLLESHFLRI